MEESLKDSVQAHSQKPIVETLRAKWAQMPYEDRIAFIDRRSQRRHESHLARMDFNYAADMLRFLRLEREMGAKVTAILEESSIRILAIEEHGTDTGE